MNPYHYPTSTPCPSCGHCPSCGRGWTPLYPWAPHWTPYTPNYFTFTLSNTAGPAPAVNF